MAIIVVELLDTGTIVRIRGERGKRYTVLHSDWQRGREVDTLWRIDGGVGAPSRTVTRDRLVVVAPPKHTR